MGSTGYTAVKTFYSVREYEKNLPFYMSEYMRYKDEGFIKIKLTKKSHLIQGNGEKITT